jgi:fructosamine-3-kinase
MNKTLAREMLLAEYPFLQMESVRIKKQFVSSDGRVSNTYLVESNKRGFEKFIAKSVVHHPESLKKEWIFLNLLQQKKAHAPRLLIKQHQPINFLLMEYIDGITASEALQNGQDTANIFKKIGETTGLANSVQLKSFGDILNPTDISWKEFQMDRLNNALPLVKKLVKKDLYCRLTEIIKSTQHILDTESKGRPMLVHHDIYLENFLVNKRNELILIDYGIAFGGRPLFDLAKFYIWDLSKYPKQKSNFLNAYSKHVSLPPNFNEVMKFYVIRECFGMMDFFHKIEDFKARDLAINVLNDLANNEGIISELLR